MPGKTSILRSLILFRKTLQLYIFMNVLSYKSSIQEVLFTDRLENFCDTSALKSTVLISVSDHKQVRKLRDGLIKAECS